MKNLLITGQNGFLLRNTIQYFSDYNIIPYEYGKEYDKIDLIVHFASPTDSYEFQDKEKMAETMIDMTIRIVDEAIANDCKLIFASSMAAVDPQDDYGIYKRAMEQYIQAFVKDNLILRIPRVYGKDKNKGLMKKIRLGHIPEQDILQEIEYVDIEDYKKWFKNILSKNSVQYYTNKYRTNSILEIGEIYCES